MSDIDPLWIGSMWLLTSAVMIAHIAGVWLNWWPHDGATWGATLVLLIVMSAVTTVEYFKDE